MIQRPSTYSNYVANGLTVIQRGNELILDGTSTTAVLIFFDKDRETKGHTSIWGQGFNTNFFNIHNVNCSFKITSGHRYQATCRLKSGSITRSGVTYTSMKQIGDSGTNVVALYLMNSDATASTNYIFKCVYDTWEYTIDYNTVGCFLLYTYSGITADNAVFEIKFEDITLKDQSSLSLLSQQVNSFYNNTDSIIQTISDLPEFTSVNTLRISGKDREVHLYGTNTDDPVFLFIDNINPMGSARYSKGFNPNFFSTYNQEHVINIDKQHCYKLHFRLKSGSVTRGGVTYTTTQQLADSSSNVVRAYLMKSSCSSSDDRYFKWPDMIIGNIDETTIGTLGMYIYAGCTFNDAIFEIYLEDYTLSLRRSNIELENYWETEITSSINSIVNNIMESQETSSTICFVTDCHWKANWRKSPLIIKELIKHCNINYFINGGDMLYAHTSTKQEAVNELSDCLSAFQECGLPMYCLYGNHDRNRNSNTDNTAALIDGVEFINLIMKSFIYRPEITYFIENGGGISYYWEDENYRYVGLYWYNSSSRTLDCLDDIVNTTKPLVILCHGIYYTVDTNMQSDVTDGTWILNLFEPYKTQIRCFIQGHTHYDALRYAYNGEVPIILLAADTCQNSTTSILSGIYGYGTIREQSVAVITIDDLKIQVVKVGKGVDFNVESNTSPFITLYTDGQYVITPST